ncbi:hypothetical protein K5X82_08455 [Halosquirtibacter xylanolyticus]|uniref:hypothetical protein n=1 Tax=Halosquirtibacter xylanolyticus TaxID=3374599 RepID=UPI003748282B|nr:hypothetical protein K5X82_08455 [Prolixibacteraceae bacterium]
MKTNNFLMTLAVFCLVLVSSCSKSKDDIGNLEPQQNTKCPTASGSCVMVENAVSKAILKEFNVFRADPVNYKFHNRKASNDVTKLLQATKPLPKFVLSEELCKGEKQYISVLCYESKWGHEYDGTTPLQRAVKGGMVDAKAATELLYRTNKDECNPRLKDINTLAKQIVTSYCNDLYDTDKHNLKALLDPSWKYAGMSYYTKSCYKGRFYYGILLAK